MAAGGGALNFDHILPAGIILYKICLLHLQHQPPPQLIWYCLMSGLSVIHLLNDVFSSRDLDYFFLTKNWLNNGDVVPLGELTLASCTFCNSPRHVGCGGGGLATVYRNQYHCNLLPVCVFFC